jgi:uncharacterized protein (TIGR00299 family) protein
LPAYARAVRIGYLDPLSGASGDMLLGAAVDAGARLDDVVAVLDGLALDGWALRADEVVRGGIAATSVVLLVAGSDEAVVRTYGNVRGLLENAALPERVRLRALGAFQRMAEVQGRLERRSVEHVHFSQIGALDAIIDVVGACAALDLLGVESVVCGPVAQGVGMVRGEHGLSPVPAPAVLELLRGAPTFATGEPFELCTPTGAALLAEWSGGWGPMPPLRVDRVGYGAGTRELDRPNILRLVLGEALPTTAEDPEAVELFAVAPAAGYGKLVEALRDAGAHDAWVVPTTGDQVIVACVAATELTDELRRVLAEGTGSAVVGRAARRWR